MQNAGEQVSLQESDVQVMSWRKASCWWVDWGPGGAVVLSPKLPPARQLCCCLHRRGNKLPIILSAASPRDCILPTTGVNRRYEPLAGVGGDAPTRQGTHVGPGHWSRRD